MLVLLVGGQTFIVDVEVLEKSSELHALEDDSNAANYAGVVCNYVIAFSKNHVSTRSSVITSKSVQFKIMLN